MFRFLQFVSPRVALADLRAFFGGLERHQLIFGALALLATGGVITVFVLDSVMSLGRDPPQLIYVESWRANRSDAEIRAEQIREQRARKLAERQWAAEQKAALARLGF
jgi:hypothetical protein